MKWKKQSGSISAKLFYIYMVLFLVTGIVLFSSFFLRFDHIYRQQADSHMADITDMSAENIRNMEEQIDQFSVSVLTDRVVQENLKIINEKNAVPDAVSEEGSIFNYETEISQQVRGNVFNMEGIISFRIYPREGGEIFVGTTNREYLEYSMTEEAIYEANGASLWGMAGEEHCICMGRAILNLENMEPLGYMVIICKNGYLGNQLSAVSDTYSGKIYLVNDKNAIVTFNEENVLGKTFPYDLRELLREAPQTIKDPVSGEKSYYYIEDAMENGWALVTTVSSSQFWNSILTVAWQMALMLCIVLVVSLILIVVAIQKLLKPVGELLESMSQFGAGKLDSRVEVQTEDEIGQIGEAYNHMADSIQKLMEQVYLLELENKEAEISFLKMQINPHFLYNSLDTISWLGFAAGNEKISEISVALAKILRASIKRADMVTIEEEMQIVKNYLFIQESRFEDKIRVVYQVDEETRGFYMPGFLLQPLVENSIIHGMEQEIKGSCLTISISREGEWVYFQVSDDGKGMEKEQLELLKQQCQGEQGEKGIGLKNVYRRLQLLYGESCEFQIISEPGQGTSISFRIPVIKKQER